MAKKTEWPYYLQDHTITPEDNDRIAKVQTGSTVTLEDIADRICKERSEYRKETLMNIFNMGVQTALDFLSECRVVNDGISIVEPVIGGVFMESNEYDPNKNSCYYKARTTVAVQALQKSARGKYSGYTVENGGATIEGIVDMTTGATDGTVTPNELITIIGKKIRVVPEEGDTVESCITYTNVLTDTVMAQTSVLATNDPQKIILKLPMLPAGEHRLTIKTLFSSSNTNLKSPRYITAKMKLKV